MSRNDADLVALRARESDPEWTYKVEEGVGIWEGKYSIRVLDESGIQIGYWPPFPGLR